jgi:hypothetical protein
VGNLESYDIVLRRERTGGFVEGDRNGFARGVLETKEKVVQKGFELLIAEEVIAELVGLTLDDVLKIVYGGID